MKLLLGHWKTKGGYAVSKDKNLVLLTSALYTNYGIYKTEERIQQTLDTAKSARKYIPNSIIVLVDNSKVDVQQDDSDEINELIDSVDYYIDNSDDGDIKLFHETCDNYDVGKNVMEALGIFKTLNHIKSDKDMLKELNNVKRVFKLSGRYQVTEKFNIANWDHAGKWVFKKAQPGWINPEVSKTTTLLQTRLWSFDPSLIDETIKIYDNIIKTMIELTGTGGYIDNEHAWSRFVPKDKLVELETVGLQGNIAPNGMMIID